MHRAQTIGHSVDLRERPAPGEWVGVVQETLTMPDCTFGRPSLGMDWPRPVPPGSPPPLQSPAILTPGVLKPRVPPLGPLHAAKQDPKAARIHVNVLAGVFTLLATLVILSFFKFVVMLAFTRFLALTHDTKSRTSSSRPAIHIHIHPARLYRQGMQCIKEVSPSPITSPFPSTSPSPAASASTATPASPAASPSHRHSSRKSRPRPLQIITSAFPALPSTLHCPGLAARRLLLDGPRRSLPSSTRNMTIKLLAAAGTRSASSTLVKNQAVPMPGEPRASKPAPASHCQLRRARQPEGGATSLDISNEAKAPDAEHVMDVQTALGMRRVRRRIVIPDPAMAAEGGVEEPKNRRGIGASACEEEGGGGDFGDDFAQV
ncbi:hypothetical protein FB45DRAFT_1058171 [Roridomyces roridus]|uniref:Uncharacterized protein n=1 Tax=Roridomyces roridus TaxID=1738132 RepID=A0AAD7BXR1_9AGAR|nr:hypothetical protein FB45DRAFT_1058171 [Roridomyces roridus]